MNRREFVSLAGIAALSGCAGLVPRGASAKVLVVGGGFGGATAAKYLKRLSPGLDVVLIYSNPAYLSCPGSNEVLAGWHDLSWLQRTRSGLENHGVRVVTARVTAIDPARRKVRLHDGAELPYDRLILSPGIDMRWDAIPGYDEAAGEAAPHAWKAGRQTLLLRRQIRAMEDGGVVLITVPANPYRCPPGPYERASLIAHYLSIHKPRSKVVILDAKTQFSKQALFMRGWQALYPGRIEWVSAEKEGSIDHVDVPGRTVVTEFGEHRADVLNIIPPQKAGSVAREAQLTDASGWCPVDPRTFESTIAPCVHVIGDACIATPMPKSAFAANSQAKICAAAVIELLAGRPPDMPSLVNHCYSFLAPDYAISVTGIYEYDRQARELFATATGETPQNADKAREAGFARDWQSHIADDAFA